MSAGTANSADITQRNLDYIEKQKEAGWQVDTATTDRSTVYGRDYEHIKATKNECKWGKIPTIAGRTALGVIGVIGTLGLLLIRDDFKNYTFKHIPEVAKSDDPLVGGRFVRAAGAVAGTVGTLGLLPAISYAVGDTTFKDETIGPALNGKAEKDIYLETNRQEDLSRIPYNPTDRQSMGEHIKRLLRESPELVKQVGNYYVVIEKNREGKSVFLIARADEIFANAVTAEDYKAAGVDSILVYNQDGTSIKSERELLIAIGDYCDIMDEMDKLKEEVVTERAQILHKRWKDDPEKNTLNLEGIKALVRNNIRHVKLIVGEKESKLVFYGDIDPNTMQPKSFLCGTYKTLGKETHKNLAIRNNSNLTEYKMKLDLPQAPKPLQRQPQPQPQPQPPQNTPIEEIDD